MKRYLRVFALFFVVCIPAQAISGIAQDAPRVYLRRTTIDPSDVSQASRSVVDTTTLRLFQFETAPDSAMLGQLRAAGVTPLVYVPDQAYLVRAPNGGRSVVAGLRWNGPFLAAYKIAPELDGLRTATGVVDIVMLATPDANVVALGDAVRVAGGQILGSAPTVFGVRLQVHVAASAIPTLLAREDVMWVEPAPTPVLFNDVARGILQIDVARAQFPGLDGQGQTIAIADTGLDIQGNVQAGANQDFASARVAGTNLCPNGGDWSDRSGHGTHVAGIAAGSGSMSGGQFAGVAPQANLLVQNVGAGDSGGVALCDFDLTTLLQQAHDNGARVQSASWGYVGSGGLYTAASGEIDAFTWQHDEQLVVVAAGNNGEDCAPKQGSVCQPDGVIDAGSVAAPGTAKNVLTVGASESRRPERTATWGGSLATIAPISGDRRSDNPNGIAAFSGRGPTIDGRIKPEIVAPGTDIISSVSHAAYYQAYYPKYGLNYAYQSGTSMATPMVSGAAALVRQWLAEQRGLGAPSAALVKALLLNGATNLAPGQYGEGEKREIPATWPNSVQGWGRANVASAIGLGETPLIVDVPKAQGVRGLEMREYSITLAARQTVRVTLVWTDPPSPSFVGRALLNNLDLELRSGETVLARGNEQAALRNVCRVNGYDVCNNAEALVFTAPAAGNYTIRVYGAAVPGLVGQPETQAQPFALVASSPAPARAPERVQATTSPDSPLIHTQWAVLPGATSYEVRAERLSAPSSIATRTTLETGAFIVGDAGFYRISVRGCNANGCGPWSAPAEVTVTMAARKVFAPLASRP